MTSASRYIRRDQISKISANRKRLADAQDADERERELIRRLSEDSAQCASGVQIMHPPALWWGCQATALRLGREMSFAEIKSRSGAQVEFVFSLGSISLQSMGAKDCTPQLPKIAPPGAKIAPLGAVDCTPHILHRCNFCTPKISALKEEKSDVES
jgi:hypothetical protein